MLLLKNKGRKYIYVYCKINPSHSPYSCVIIFLCQQNHKETLNIYNKTYTKKKRVHRRVVHPNILFLPDCSYELYFVFFVL